MAAMSKKIFAQIYLVYQLCPFCIGGPIQGYLFNSTKVTIQGEFLFELLCCAVDKVALEDNSEVIYDPESSNITS